MADNDKEKSKGPRTEVIVALIGLVGVVSVALIENWNNIFPNKTGDAVATPTPIVSSTPQVPISPPASTIDSTITPTSPSPTPLPSPASSGCVLTVSNPLVSLKSKPEHLSQDIIGVKPGEYSSLDYVTTNFGGIREEGWFQIEAEGRRGWIANDTWTIDGKTSACP